LKPRRRMKTQWVESPSKSHFDNIFEVKPRKNISKTKIFLIILDFRFFLDFLRVFLEFFNKCL
jgi:hypothetical protein